LTWKPKGSAHLEELGGDGRKYLEGFFLRNETQRYGIYLFGSGMGLNALLGYSEQVNVPTFRIQAW